MSDAVFNESQWRGAVHAPSASNVWTRGRTVSAAIVAVAAGLMGLGAVMTFSAAATIDAPMVGWPFWQYPALRQLVFLAGALIAMLLMTQVSYRVWGRGRGLPAMILLAISLAASATVLVPGIGLEINNARRWIGFGPANWGLRIQPSELVKVAMPVFLAVWMTRLADIRRFWKGFVPAVIVIGICAGIVGIEDFGTAALLAGVGGAMLMAGGAKWRHIMLLILPTVPAFGYLLMSRSHRMERLLIFLDIWKDPEGKGYQAIQSLCTIASGGWWGRGLGGGFVKGYLPAARTDFIYAVICEELGMIGAVAVIGLMLVLVWNGREVFLRCADPMGRLLAFGITTTIGIQAAMNIAVVTVSVPTKGIALPLVSAGGSGAIVMGGLVGILASIPRRGQISSEEPRLAARTLEGT